MRIKVLLAGCGDIAQRLAARLDQSRYYCIGLRRNIERLPASIEGLAWDLQQEHGLEAVLPADVDVVVVTLVPSERSDRGYYQAYVKNLSNLLAALNYPTLSPPLILFASSTSVYGQNSGEWVDEDSVTDPTAYNGQRLLEAEQLLEASPLPHCVLRFSGIYGPGRERLLRQVADGELERDTNPWTNRIHADDCAGVLEFLIELSRQLPGQERLPEIVLASDCEPRPHTDVTYWLAQQLGKPVPDHSQAVQGGKRCSNRRLLTMGYEFKYPTFREGYGAMLEEEK